jgi:uncharacterized protein (TIGR02118 family)
MFKVTVIYPRTVEDEFNFTYYRDIHTPMVKKLLGPFGLVRVDIETGVSGPAPGSEPPYIVICGIFFNELQSLHEGLAAEGATLIGDIANFTSVIPEMQISQVE